MSHRVKLKGVKKNRRKNKKSKRRAVSNANTAES
jgi:hypothetical protein